MMDTPLADEIRAIVNDPHADAFERRTRAYAIVARIAKLERTVRECRPMDCSDCGPMVKVDEDGCCVTCGREAIDTQEGA